MESPKSLIGGAKNSGKKVKTWAEVLVLGVTDITVPLMLLCET